MLLCPRPYSAPDRECIAKVCKNRSVELDLKQYLVTEHNTTENFGTHVFVPSERINIHISDLVCRYA